MSEKLSGALQENLLTLLAFNEKSCALIRSSIEPELFSSAIFRDIVVRCYDYIDRYKKPPADHLPDLLEDVLSKGDQTSRLYADILEAAHDAHERGLNEEYVLSQLEGFVRQQRLKVGVVKASEAISDGDLEAAEIELENALRTRLQLFSPGLKLEDGVQQALHVHRSDVVATGIPHLDKAGLGPGRGELHLFIAPPKRGKSWWLVHMSKRCLMQRLNTIYLTLELSEAQIIRRHLQAWFALPQSKLKLDVTRLHHDDLGRLVKLERETLDNRITLDDPQIDKIIRTKLKRVHGRENLLVKGFPAGTLTVKGIDAYLDALERMHNFIPDALVIDYPDYMKISSENFRIDLGQIFVDLRGLAQRRNIAVIAAKKSNRAGAAARLVTETHSGEDYSVIFTADTVLTYSQTLAERELGLGRLLASNTRVGDRDGFVVLLSQAYKIGQFCLSAVEMSDTYWSHLEALVGKDAVNAAAPE